MRRPDLRDLAIAVLQDRGVELQTLEIVRSRFRAPRIVALRHAVIRRAHSYGYRGVDISGFLRVSSATVSRALNCEEDLALLA